jgi:hypothetical protein
VSPATAATNDALVPLLFQAGVALEESLREAHRPDVTASIEQALAALDVVIVAARAESFVQWASTASIAAA